MKNCQSQKNILGHTSQKRFNFFQQLVFPFKYTWNKQGNNARKALVKGLFLKISAKGTGKKKEKGDEAGTLIISE
ncbi:hypothetical protein [uncultured Sphaerochaeta sp.]|uniref:hypothetical protein n=1 Tax=uncultured Sphaerochaeta sp. TaxID=886478 RepID=UPI002A0A77C5|nr:hypothetical protein [uncultured Sphaerochaeta sp.]